ncbi:hypothetical protein KZ483_04315 [Paenibacillus sp. sptzw28]|uniref:hypothetical protein n=1 Tax=Paenibacillus sp. sptzw28 TaxID=715179 RepID=UPI001C6EFD1B|nr:hypothetical protein [Paenibacillus sp. sptzw28]QYR22229.1 hypothetical protein KZ483_04315 [Paenibacillus sp. sptzw28]
MEYDGNLYAVDVNQNTIQPILANQVGQYDIQELDKKYVEDLVPTWGTNAVVSPDGNLLLYHSTRNVLYDDNFNGQMWVKDLKTGQEEPVTDGGYSVIGWGAQNEVYVRRAEKVEKVNVKTKETSVVVDFALDAGLSYPYLIHQEEYGKLKITNLETNERKDLTFESLNRVGPIRTKEGSPWVMMFNAPDSTQPERTLVLINLQTQEVKQMQEPTSTFFTDGQWISESQFLVNVRQKDSDVEETYILNVNEVE